MNPEDAIRKYIDKDKSHIERIEGTYKEGGFMQRRIEEAGGDPSYLKDVRKALDDLYRALEEAEYGALAHMTQEHEDPAIADVKRLAGLK